MISLAQDNNKWWDVVGMAINSGFLGICGFY